MKGVLQCVAVCCSVLQCVAVCCSVLRCVAVCCCVCWNVLLWSAAELAGDTVWVSANGVLQCVAECSRVLQCVAVCSRVLQCVAECCSVAVHCVLQQNWREILYGSNDVLHVLQLHNVLECYCVLQYVAVWCSVVQCVFACSRYILYGDLYTNSTNSAAGKDTLHHRV